MKEKNTAQTKSAKALLDFIDRSPTPFHAVEEMGRTLADAGFARLEEAEVWKLKKNGKYFVVRNDSSMIVFSVGRQAPASAGFKIAGAHTDSPNLRLKPKPAFDKCGYRQLGVEVYGGALLGTWTDRDLSLAGRVILRTKQGLPRSRLIKIDRTILRIPQLAIHLNRDVNDKGLVLNKQTHLPPILGLADAKLPTEQALASLVAGEAKCKASEILGLELSLFDLQKSAVGGLDREFLFAPRLDNLASCHAAVSALLSAEKLDAATRVLAFYDNEEVGSESAQGAGSPFLKDTLERISLAFDGSRESFMRASARSIFLSLDMAHAVHPNYAERHEQNHQPAINGGPVIKTHSGQRYATEGMSAGFFEQLCERAEVPVQKFVMRSDLQCGSTIGPITAAELGMRTADAGSPMLSMHSVREMAGVSDHDYMIRVLREYFKP